jgi:putative transposase
LKRELDDQTPTNIPQRLPISARVISYAVWLYFRFPLRLRMVEEVLEDRSVDVTYETVLR